MAPINESYTEETNDNGIDQGNQEDYAETFGKSQPSTSRTSETVDNVITQATTVELQPQPHGLPVIPEDEEDLDISTLFDDIQSMIDHVQIPQQRHAPPPHDHPCQPQPDLAKPSTLGTLESIVNEFCHPQHDDSQPGKLHQKPASASTFSSSDQGDHVVRSHGKWVMFPDSTNEHQSQPKAQITNQPKSVQRVRYVTEHTHQQLAGQNGLPITLTVTNITSGRAPWKAIIIICCIENNTNSLILHSNGLHLMNTKKAKNAEGPLESLLSIPIELNPENSQLELKLTNVATHHITNDQASNYMPEVHSQLEGFGVTSVELPSLERYRSPPDFRLLFSIVRNKKLVHSVISDPIRDGKPWKIVECVGKRTPILMTEQKELSVFLSDFPQNSNNKITASFSYKDEGDNDVVFPGKGKDKEIPLRRINQGGGTFITPLFPTPNPSREVKVSLSLHTRAKSEKKNLHFHLGYIDSEKV